MKKSYRTAQPGMIHSRARATENLTPCTPGTPVVERWPVHDFARGDDTTHGRSPVERHYQSPVKESQGHYSHKSDQRTVPRLWIATPGEEDKLDSVSRKRERDVSVVVAKAVLTPANKNFSNEVKVQLAEERCHALRKAVESLRKQVEELKEENKELREKAQIVSSENEDEDCQLISVQAYPVESEERTGSALSTAQESGSSPSSLIGSTEVGKQSVEHSTSEEVEDSDVDEPGISLGWVMNEADLKFEDLVRCCPSLQVIVDLPTMSQTVNALDASTREGNASKKAKLCV